MDYLLTEGLDVLHPCRGLLYPLPNTGYLGQTLLDLRSIDAAIHETSGTVPTRWVRAA